MNRMRNKGGWGSAFAGRLALLIFSSCVALGLGELLVRALNPMEPLSLLDAEDRSIYVRDLELGYRLKPNAEAWLQTAEFSVRVWTNSDGYRDDEFAAETAGPVVAGLGDSFGFGNGVESDETFFQLAEHRLRETMRRFREMPPEKQKAWLDRALEEAPESTSVPR